MTPWVPFGVSGKNRRDAFWISCFPVSLLTLTVDPSVSGGELGCPRVDRLDGGRSGKEGGSDQGLVDGSSRDVLEKDVRPVSFSCVAHGGDE